jgi:hypothetical protein
MLSTSPAASDFTNTLLKNVREQRHKAIRIIVATQEPTVNPALLDLCSITFVHRFTSPAWFSVLRKHLAGVYKFEIDSGVLEEAEGEGSIKPKSKTTVDLFRCIIRLRVGESLLFGPTATLCVSPDGSTRKLNEDHIKFRTRMRLTQDGGRSRLANGSEKNCQ